MKDNITKSEILKELERLASTYKSDKIKSIYSKALGAALRIPETNDSDIKAFDNSNVLSIINSGNTSEGDFCACKGYNVVRNYSYGIEVYYDQDCKEILIVRRNGQKIGYTRIVRDKYGNQHNKFYVNGNRCREKQFSKKLYQNN